MNTEVIVQVGFLRSFFLHAVKVPVIIKDRPIKIFSGFINLFFSEVFLACRDLCSDC